MPGRERERERGREAGLIPPQAPSKAKQRGLGPLGPAWDFLVGAVNRVRL